MMDVARELAELHGSEEPPGPGILHVAYVARDREGRLCPLRIGTAATPASESDAFVLQAARAHADAVLTSAENLRREPSLSHAPRGPWAEALTRYRRDVLKKTAPLTCAILTRSGDLPVPHPVWSDGTDKLIFVPDGSLSSRGSGSSLWRELGARIVALPDLDALRASAWLRAHGAERVSIEAGPRTVRTLYEARAVTELWLTHWESATEDAELAGALPEDDLLFHGLSLLGSSRRIEHGESFRFERWAKQRSV